MKYKFIIILTLFCISYAKVFSQNIGIRLPAATLPNTALDVNGAVSYREGTPLSIANGTNNNVTLDSMSFYRITAPTANFTITGFTNGQNGRVLVIVNATSFTMTLSHLAGTSSAANQIRTASATNLLIDANGVVTLMYSSNLTKWVVIGVTASNASAYNAWGLTGNSGTTAGTNFIGTTDNQNLVFRTNNATSLILPVEGRGGLLRVNNNRYGSVYLSQIGFQSESYPTNVDTSFSIFGSIGSNDFFKIFGISTARTAATDGEFHIMSGDDGNEPIIFEQYDQAGSLVYERMRIHSDGHVGIGANTPVYKLQIEEPGGYDGDIGVRLYNNNNITFLPSLILQASRGTKTTPTALTNGYPMGAIYYGGYDGSGFVDITGASITGRTTQDWTSSAHGAKLEFYTIPNGSTTQTQRMVIDQNGNVGIGVASPSVKLHQDNGTATANYYKFTANGTTGQTVSDGFDVGVDASGNAVINQKEALPLVMSANNAEIMRLTSAGNMLIGGNLTPAEATGVALVNQSANDLKDDITITTYNTTATPALVLFKARGTAASPSALTDNENLGGVNTKGHTGSGFTSLSAISTITASDYTTSSGADLSFSTARSGSISERMRIASTGNVGIGCTAPQYNLHVIGTIGASTSIRSPATTTGAILACSDIRYKKNIHPLSNALEKVLKIQGVTYDWRVNEFPDWKFSSKNQIGVIAQEIEKIYPELVETDEKGYKSVDYSKMTPILVEAIKEQQGTIEKQQKEIADLKNKNQQTQQELEVLKKQMVLFSAQLEAIAKKKN